MYFLNILSLLQKSANSKFHSNQFRAAASEGGGLNHCALLVLSSRKISRWLSASVVSHCLATRTHINRETRIHILCEMPGAEPFPRFLLVVSVLFSLSPRACLCVCVFKRPDGGATRCLSAMPTPAAPPFCSFFVSGTEPLVWLFGAGSVQARQHAAPHCSLVPIKPA